jgi:hypothetical protein
LSARPAPGAADCGPCNSLQRLEPPDTHRRPSSEPDTVLAKDSGGAGPKCQVFRRSVSSEQPGALPNFAGLCSFNAESSERLTLWRFSDLTMLYRYACAGMALLMLPVGGSSFGTLHGSHSGRG